MVQKLTKINFLRSVAANYPFLRRVGDMLLNLTVRDQGELKEASLLSSLAAIC